MDVQQMLDAKALELQRQMRRWAKSNGILPGHQIVVTISTVVPVEPVVVQVKVPVVRTSRKGGVVATFRPLQQEEWTKILVAVAGSDVWTAFIRVLMANNGKTLTIAEIVQLLPESLRENKCLGYRLVRDNTFFHSPDDIRTRLNLLLRSLDPKFGFRADFGSPRGLLRRYAICPLT